MHAADEEDEMTGHSPDVVEVSGDPTLLAQGWERRSMVEPVRAEEVQALYTSLGFEVRIEPLDRDDFGAACAGCAESACHEYVLVYTRRHRP